MSYEEAIKAKHAAHEKEIKARHAFQDSFETLLWFLSVMDYRELELAAAKLADGIEEQDERIDQKSALLTGKIIYIILKLRDKGYLSNNKIKRRWVAGKQWLTSGNKNLSETIAQQMHEHQLGKYEREVAKIESIRSNELQHYENQLEEWGVEEKSRSFFQRMFRPRPRPQRGDLTPWPKIPPTVLEVAEQIRSQNNIGELLILRVYFYSFPYFEQADTVVNESNIRSTSTRLLESKR